MTVKNIKLSQAAQLINTMALMKMKANANKMLLGYLWWILEPLLFVAVFFVVFEYILRRGGEGFFVFLLVGKMAFLWFSKSVTLASMSLRQNKGLISQRAMPKWIFPLSSVQEATYKSIIAFGLMMLMLWIIGTSEPANWWRLLPLLLLNYWFVSSVAVFASILVTWVEDFSQIISLAMMGLMFGSGIFWNVRDISNPEVVWWIYTLNPVAALLDAYRQVLIENSTIEYGNLISLCVVSLSLWAISLLIMKRKNNQLTRCLYS